MHDNVFQKNAETVPHAGVLRPQDFDGDFSFVRYAVPEELAQYVDHIWIIRWEFEGEIKRYSPAVLPSPQINLYFSSTGEAGAQGVFRANRTYEAAGIGCVVGTTFRPGGFFVFWPHPAYQITDRSIGIKEVFPQGDTQFANRLLNLSNDDVYRHLAALLQSKQPLHDTNIQLVQNIVAYIAENDTVLHVGDIARAFGKSVRSLQQLFRSYVGVSIKWVLLRNRLIAAVSGVRTEQPVDWSRLALDLGYASQAHFIADFKRIAGMTPVTFMRLQRMQSDGNAG